MSEQQGVTSRECGKLVRCGDEFAAGETADFGCHRFGIAGWRVEAGADCGTAERQFAQQGQAGTQAAFGMRQLRDPARDFLAEAERGGVLQMGTADLDDAGKSGRLVGEHLLQITQRGQQLLFEAGDRSDMHRGRKHVIARLAAIDLVVGVHQALLAAHATEQFAGTIGQHFVEVHVGLGAGAGLPDHEREFVRVLASEHFVSGCNDGGCLVGGEQAKLLVGVGGSTLDQRERMDEFSGLTFARDGEVLQRALGLRAPQAGGRDFDRTEAVVFETDGHGRAPCLPGQKLGKVEGG